jgi:hypothetical protein
MLNFKKFTNAERFCRAFEEQREYFRFRLYHKRKVSLLLPRVHILGKFQQLKEKFLNTKLVWRQSLMPLQL